MEPSFMKKLGNVVKDIFAGLGEGIFHMLIVLAAAFILSMVLFRH